MRIFLVSILFCISVVLSAQKSYTAERSSGEIVIDGVLDETSWQGDYAGEFIQNEPNVGEDPSQDTRVMIRYDNDAVYVGARLLDTQPDKILKELALRDGGSNTDAFMVAFDTYKDGINAFVFVVTAAGVQKDGKFSSDGEDTSWDGVWESQISQDDKGWYVEVRIPYFTIRFAQEVEQVWGLQFSRDLRRLRENSFWNPVDPNIDGFVNQFGILRGIKDINTPFRLSATPYISGYYNSNFIPGKEGSFESGTAYSAGLDIKLGLSDAFTLDMTLIPDFGQTISDNQVLNLSPFEVFFEENRPFFTESFELFNKGRLFYTRRVGGTPINRGQVNRQLSADEVVLENPIATSLINATKISGRTSSKTGIGVFNGITAEEHAIIKDTITGLERSFVTSPLSNYNVTVFDQALKNNSFVTLMNTNVHRVGDTYDANSTGLYTSFNDKDQKYGIRTGAAMSNKFVNQDNDFGYTYNVEAGKYSGLWTYSVGHGVESDTYDPNDLGILFAPNERYYRGDASYNNYSPKNEKLNRYRYSVGTSYSTLFKPNAFNILNTYAEAFWLYKSRDAFGVSLYSNPLGTHDYFETRKSDFSSYLMIPVAIEANAFFSSDYRKTFAVDIRVEARKFDQADRANYQFVFSPRIRFSDKFSLFFNSNLQYLQNDQGFISRFIDGAKVVSIDSDHTLIGQRNRQILTNIITARYIFNNNMGIDLRVRHYWDKVQYNGFLDLEGAGNMSPINFSGLDEFGEPYYDINRNFFNIDMQYQWRFAPGSDIFIVWKNSISRLDRAYQENYITNFTNLFDQLQNNSLSIRAVYFLDYNRFT